MTNNKQLNNLIESFGSEPLVFELAKATSSKELHDDLNFINDNWDLGLIINSYDKDDLTFTLDCLIALLGSDGALIELTNAMTTKELDENVDCIARMLNA